MHSSATGRSTGSNRRARIRSATATGSGRSSTWWWSRTEPTRRRGFSTRSGSRSAEVSPPPTSPGSTGRRASFSTSRTTTAACTAPATSSTRTSSWRTTPGRRSATRLSTGASSPAGAPSPGAAAPSATSPPAPRARWRRRRSRSRTWTAPSRRRSWRPWTASSPTDGTSGSSRAAVSATAAASRSRRRFSTRCRRSTPGFPGRERRKPRTRRSSSPRPVRRRSMRRSRAAAASSPSARRRAFRTRRSDGGSWATRSARRYSTTPFSANFPTKASSRRCSSASSARGVPSGTGAAWPASRFSWSARAGRTATRMSRRARAAAPVSWRASVSTCFRASPRRRQFSTAWSPGLGRRPTEPKRRRPRTASGGSTGATSRSKAAPSTTRLPTTSVSRRTSPRT